MKRIVSLFIVCALVFATMTGISVNAEGITIQAGTVSATVGDTIDIPVTLSGNTGFCNLGIEIGYDSSVLTLVSAVDDKSVGATCTAAQTLTVNPYNIGWDSSTSDNTYNGKLATLTFKIADDAASGSYPVTVSYYKGFNGNYEDGEDVNYDLDYNPLDITYVNGSVTVTDSKPVETDEPYPTKAPVETDNPNPTKEPTSTETPSHTARYINAKSYYYDSLEEFDVYAEYYSDDYEYSGYIIAALYDNYGTLVSVRIEDADWSHTFEFNGISENVYVKLMWWDSLPRMTPLAEPLTITPTPYER